jgi:hypothetical protein
MNDALENELGNLLHRFNCSGMELARAALLVAQGHDPDACDMELVQGDELTRRRQTLARNRGEVQGREVPAAC